MDKPRGPRASLLRSLSRVRLEDAECLLAASIEKRQPSRRNGAVYLGGYSVECALKAKVCETQGTETLAPQYFSHNLDLLAAKTDLWPTLRNDPVAWVAFVKIKSQWNALLRYNMRPWNPVEVRKFLDLVKEFVRWLFES